MSLGKLNYCGVHMMNFLHQTIPETYPCSDTPCGVHALLNQWDLYFNPGGLH